MGARTSDDFDSEESGLTASEAKAVASLQRLAHRWPKSLTLASMCGSLVVVHTDDERFDGIPNTGGDW